MEAKLLTLDIESFSEKVLEAQGIVQSLRNDKDLALEEINSMAVMDKPSRMDTAAGLIERTSSAVSVYKELKAQVNSLQKDLEGITEDLKKACVKEMIKDTYETDSFKFKKNITKSVGVDEEDKVERKFRHQPKKHPHWTKWKVDKVKVRKLLDDDKSVFGCYLHREIKVKITRK